MTHLHRHPNRVNRFILCLYKPTGKATSALALVRQKRTSDNQQLLAQFERLLQTFGHSSDVFIALSASQHAEDHRRRLLDRYAATTVFRYFQAIHKFIGVAASLDISLPQISEVQFADILAVMRLSKSCMTDRDVCSGNFTIKAMRWWKRIAGVSSLQICFSPLSHLWIAF